MEETEFEDAIAATNLIPGPASTQLAMIFCPLARPARPAGNALVGGACFILPGLAVILAAGRAAVPGLQPSDLGERCCPRRRCRSGGRGDQRRPRSDPGQLPRRAGDARRAGRCAGPSPLSPAVPGRSRWDVPCARAARLPRPGGDLACSGQGAAAPAHARLRHGAARGRRHRWTGNVDLGGAQGGGAVIRGRVRHHIPLIQAWRGAPLPLDDQRRQFLNAVALGQITPGPVVQTGCCIDQLRRGRYRWRCWRRSSPSSPSFVFIALGGTALGRSRTNRVAQSFLGGAGPAAIDAIAGGHPARPRHLARVARRSSSPVRLVAIVEQRAQRGAHARRGGRDRCAAERGAGASPSVGEGAGSDGGEGGRQPVVAESGSRGRPAELAAPRPRWGRRSMRALR